MTSDQEYRCVMQPVKQKVLESRTVKVTYQITTVESFSVDGEGKDIPVKPGEEIRCDMIKILKVERKP